MEVTWFVPQMVCLMAAFWKVVLTDRYVTGELTHCSGNGSRMWLGCEG